MRPEASRPSPWRPVASRVYQRGKAFSPWGVQLTPDERREGNRWSDGLMLHAGMSRTIADTHALRAVLAMRALPTLTEPGQIEQRLRLLERVEELATGKRVLEPPSQTAAPAAPGEPPALRPRLDPLGLAGGPPGEEPGDDLTE